jgi:cytochrome b
MAVPKKEISVNILSASPAELSPEAPITLASAPPSTAPGSRRIIDAPTRMLHWLLAFSFTGAYLSAESERWQLLHFTLGYTVLGLVLFRLIWSLVGPQRSRWRAWSSKLMGLPRQLLAWPEGRGNLLASYAGLNTLAVVAVLGASLFAAASGLTLEQEWLGNWAGEWVEDVHGALGDVALALVLAHLGLIVLVSLLRRQNQALPMITGKTPGRGPDLVKRPLTPVALLILAAVAVFWYWQWQAAPADLGPLDRPAVGSRQHDDD